MIWTVSLLVIFAVIFYTYGKNSGKKRKNSLGIKILAIVGLVWAILGMVVIKIDDNPSATELKLEKAAIELSLVIPGNDEAKENAKDFNNKLLIAKLANSYYLFSFHNDKDLNEISSIDIK